MIVLIVVSSIAIPLIMLLLQNFISIFLIVFNIIAVISLIIFGNIAVASIYQILIDNNVFMTTIHGIFLNPYFSITGSYLGVFFIYRLMKLVLDER
ncbi:transposase [Heyndrickxia sporothermodurans]